MWTIMEAEAITKDTVITDLVTNFPETEEILMEFGLGCVGCPMSNTETVEQGAASHGLDPETVITSVKKRIEQEKEMAAE